LFDKTWHEWTGASLIISDLAKVYPIRKVACYKGVNVVPDVFKYYVFIEFLMTDDTAKSQDELYALDCIQKFRLEYKTSHFLFKSSISNVHSGSGECVAMQQFMPNTMTQQ